MTTVFAGPVAASHSTTKTYAVSGGGGVVAYSDSHAGLNVGGAPFADHQGEQPVRVDIADETGGPVAFTVCQDLDGNELCGEPENDEGEAEPTVDGCGTMADLSGIDWDVDHEVSVFVRTVDFVTQMPTCGLGTTGTITLSYGATA